MNVGSKLIHASYSMSQLGKLSILARSMNFCGQSDITQSVLWCLRIHSQYIHHETL